MNKSQLTEVTKERVIKAWQKQFGTMPDVESEEFKKFNYDINKQANDKYKQQNMNVGDIPVFSRKLVQTYENNPGEFATELNNAFTHLKNKDKVQLIQLARQNADFNSVVDGLLGVMVNILIKNKNESVNKIINSIQESIMINKNSKYPWLYDLLNKKLSFTEEDEDIETNINNDDQVDFDINDLDVPTDDGIDNGVVDDLNMSSDDQEDFGDDNFDINDFEDDDSHIPSASFGGVSSSTGTEDEEMGNTPMPVNTPTYHIIDLIFDDNNPESVKVKVKNDETGEIEIKNLQEVDI